ncbi:hypothetical protein CC2G_014149 [Coprinopsis cinerea AmutBmut pab1-1]|nr:hypothetical protein CC2G_014149 [Coprinopsis cinerea AmutBmut pab1-1]
MSVLNPYASWGTGSNSSNIPSIQGALPHVDFSGRSEPKWVTFTFAPQSGTDVLNSTVIDQERRARFYITTSIQNGIRTTIISDSGRQPAARIEWQGQPIIELRTHSNSIPRQYASQFVQVAPDGRSKAMVVNNKHFQWTQIPQEGVIRWNNISYNPAEPVGALYRTQGVVSLSIAPSAVALGLLDIGILVATLFSASG